MYFYIVEVDDGYTIIEVPEGGSPADQAAAMEGIIVDERAFTSFQDATDAVTELEFDPHANERAD